MDCKKTKYSSEYYAKLDLARIRKTSNRAKLPRSTYYCDKCKGWHLTSKINSGQRIIELEGEINTLNQRIAELESEGEINKLNQTVSELESENKKLRSENLLLLQRNNKEILKEVKIEDRVIKSNQKIKQAKLIIRKLRSSISDLISKNLQLEKKIKTQI